MRIHESIGRSALKPLSLAIWLAFPLVALADDSILDEMTVTESALGTPLDLGRQHQTGSRLGLSIRETPASVTVMEREILEQRGVESTKEALNSVPGITASSAPGSPGAVFYRGFGGASVTQLFNGITVQYDAIAGRAVDSWIYDRVEAVGGASGFLHGAGAVGGTINYVTRLASTEGDLTDLKAAYGRFDARQLAVGANRRIGDAHALRLDVNRSAVNGWSDGMERNAGEVAASWLARLTPALTHTLALEYQNEEVDRPYWGTPILKPVGSRVRIDEGTRFKNYNSADGIYEQTVRWARSILEYQAGERLNLRNTIYHYDALRDYRNVETYAFNATNTGVIRSNALLQRHDQTLNGNRFEFTWQDSLGGRSTTWAGGVDYSINKQTRFPLSVAGPFGTVDPYDFTTENFFSLPGVTPGFNPDRSNRVKTLAAFLENRTLLTPTLSLLTGLRHDRIDLEVTNHRTATATNPAFFARHYTPTTGRIALAWDVTPNANVYVQYSTAADPPSGILTTATFTQVRDFDLTTGKQWEIGSKFSFDDGRGSGTLAYYDITRRNIAVSDVNNPGTTIPVGQQSSRGIEVALAYRITSAWQLAGNLSLVDVRYDEFNETVGGVAVSRAGKQPANIPRRVGNLWLTYRPLANLELGSDLRHVSSRYANSANTLSDDAYTLLGAYASYQLDRRTRIVLRGKNLTDRIYAESFSGTNMVYLGRPRTVDLSIQTSF
ncbi:MAG: TonB-dependent siderophore receptor [Dechloromonas sp.]|nr:MAG: TonB-dependent siderophore receptor [Dechloromonas sp.]